jgi:hypothetical protein
MSKHRTESIETDITKFRPHHRSDVRIRDVDGELVVLDLGARRVHQLNPTARNIWNQCNGQQSIADIVDQLCASFDIDRVTAEKDVTSLVRQLKEAGLLQQA